MEAMFGESFWDFTIIAVSHWAFDSNSIFNRNHTGENESWFLKQWNEQFKEKFHFDRDLSGVFIDSFSQKSWNIDHQCQQKAFYVRLTTCKCQQIFKIKVGINSHRRPASDNLLK